MQFIDGRSGGRAQVGYIPSEVAVYFSALTSIVHIDKPCAIKLLTRHKLTYNDFGYIQRAIDNGYIMLGRDWRFLEFAFVDDAGPYRHYLLVLKVARYGQEVWVQTFHRSDETTFRSKLRKLKLLREHA